MRAGIVLLSFGEPEDPDLEGVVAYLERIFRTNASLEDPASEEAARGRSRELAERRGPGLLEEYREIGGSPLNAQARAQAEALDAELTRRGLEARAHVGMQFTEPFVAEAVGRALDDGAERLVGLPAYPLCGRSTTVAALEEMARAVRHARAGVKVREVSGWHRHPGYLELRADAIRCYAERAGLDLADPATRVVFSAHGTPLRYLDEGNRYDRYVDEWCQTLASRLAVSHYTLGFQNHANRGVEWTRPDVDEAIRGLVHPGAQNAPAGVERIVVDAVSFMHEQSETLAELDRDLREEVEGLGLEFHRVPVPWDDPRFVSVLVDLVEPLIADSLPAGFRYGDCRCRPGAACLNAVEETAFAARL